MRRAVFSMALAVSLLLILGCCAQAEEEKIYLTLNEPYVLACDGPTDVSFWFAPGATGAYTLSVEGCESFTCWYGDLAYDSEPRGDGTGFLSADAFIAEGEEEEIILETYSDEACEIRLLMTPGTNPAIIAYDSYHAVDFGGTTALTAYGYDPDGEPDYRWVSIVTEGGSVTETLIEGADQNEYVIPPATQNQDYACLLVGPDGAELCRTVFHVEIRANLSAHIVGNSNKYVTPMEYVTLEVSARADYGEIRYQWYYEGDYATGWTLQKMEGETGPTLTVMCSSKRTITYVCRVSDYQDNLFKSLYFSVCPDNHLDVNAERVSVYAFPGDTVTLKGIATCDKGGIQYQWSRMDYSRSYEGEEMPLEGENGDTLTLNNVQTSGTFYLRVTDDYDNSSSCWFHVIIPNGLTLTDRSAGTVYAAPGESLTFSVRAQCASGGITYQWFNESLLLEGETGNSCTVVYDETKSGYYHCVAKDQYQNRVEVTFQIMPGSQVNAWPVGGEYLELKAGETGTLSVAARSAGNRPLTYQWRVFEDYNEEGQIIPGAAGPSLQVDSLGGDKSYLCIVSDPEGNTAQVYFVVMVDSGLVWNYEDEYVILPGESATLEVDAWSESGPVTYQWYGQEEDGMVLIEGATSATYTTGPLTADGEYECLISDGYSEERINLMVRVKNPGITVTPAGSTRIECLEGEEITLAVSVNGATETDRVYYSWRKSGTSLSNEGGNTLRICAGAGNEVYTCEVSVNGIDYDVSFQVLTSAVPEIHADEPAAVRFSRDNPAVLSFTPDSPGMYRFSVTRQGLDFGNIRFQVYDSEWEGIIGTTGDSPFFVKLPGGRPCYLTLSLYGQQTLSGTLEVTRVSESHSGSFTMIAGQCFVFPSRSDGSVLPEISVSDAPGVVRTVCENIAAVSPGTAHVTVTYDDGYQLFYTVTVVPRSTPVLKVPKGVGAVQAGAFEGDGSVQYARLGTCLYVGSRAFAGTDLRQIVFDMPSGRNPYIAPDAFAGASPLIVGNGYMQDYAEEHGFEFLLVRYEAGGNG